MYITSYILMTLLVSNSQNQAVAGIYIHPHIWGRKSNHNYETQFFSLARFFKSFLTEETILIYDLMSTRKFLTFVREELQY